MDDLEIKLTAFTTSGGCGCKLAPGELSELLRGKTFADAEKGLWVGKSNSDDAAVIELPDGSGLISTVDFFTPVVDDPFDFGCVSAANALSDVYAMGGNPVLALAVLGWPTDKIPLSYAGKVLEGALKITGLAGVPLGGGHTIEAPEPFFGLSVNGLVSRSNLKRNNTPNENDLIFLTKPLGTGILSTALKRGLVDLEIFRTCLNSMCLLNETGRELGALSGVSAMTDVSGFGLLGHLFEMTRERKLGAELFKDKIPVFPGVSDLTKNMVYPDATFRNWKAVSHLAKGVDPSWLLILSDPQTSGGLLFTAPEQGSKPIRELLESKGLNSEPIGRILSSTPPRFTLI
jgi:selenide, water dikinase